MSRTRFDNRLSDSDARLAAEVEAHLDRHLAIEPSPEFVAKVRARIGRQRAERRWGATWIAVSLASAAVIVVAAAMVLRPDHPRADVPVAHGPVLPDTLLPAPPVVLMLVTASPRLAGVRPQPVRQVTEPEVLIDASLAEAIRRVAAQARGKAAGPKAFENVGSSPSETQLSVPSVVVDPLNVPELVLPPAEAAGSGTAGSTEHQKE